MLTGGPSWEASMRYDAAAIAAAELHFREGIWGAAPGDAIDELEIRKRWFGPILATACAGLAEAPLMNVVQGAAEPGAVEQGDLAAAVEWMRSREVHYLVQVVSDRPGSAVAEAWLAARGYEQGPTMRRYVRPLSEPVAAEGPEVELRELSATATEGMSLIFADAIGLSDLATVPLLGLPEVPGWHCYAAFLEGREVACGAMLLDEEIAIFGLDATAPDARNHGCQSALIRRRLTDAAHLGARTAVAEACIVPDDRAAAARNFQRAGFIEAGRSVGWHRPLISAEGLQGSTSLR
jgi:ribosomal protein S18 acetylase RimI-like enzyme